MAHYDLYFTNPDTGFQTREGVRDGSFVIDSEREIGGFGGLENEGWINIKCVSHFRFKLTLISGGVKIDWHDITGGLARTEIWGRVDQGDYVLITTANAGVTTYNDTQVPVDLMTYKLRTVINDVYSEFTRPRKIALLSNELIVNGDFSDDALWDLFGNSSINSALGECTITADGTAGNELSQDNVMTPGQTYRIRYTIKTNTLVCTPGYEALRMYNSGAWVVPVPNFIEDSVGDHLYDALAVSEYFGMRTWPQTLSGSIVITNVSVKEILFP